MQVANNAVVISNARVHTFQSWERDSSERCRLTVIRTDSAVQIAYLGSDGESSLLVLSIDDAEVLGDAFLKLAPSYYRVEEVQFHRRGQEEDEGEPRLSIRVCATNRGEPYETGVLFGVCGNDDSYDIHAELNASQAHGMGKALKKGKA